MADYHPAVLNIRLLIVHIVEFMRDNFGALCMATVKILV